MERMTAAGRLGPPLAFLNGESAVAALLLERNKSRAGLVGIEYLVEMVGGSRKEPVLAYECVLCGVSLPTKGAAVHHVLQNVHKVAFLEKHFPLSIEPVRPHMQLINNTWRFNIDSARRAIRHICWRIEERFGRQRPSMIRFDNYMRSKQQYVRKIEDAPHFVEDVPVPLDQFQFHGEPFVGEYDVDYVDEEDAEEGEMYYDVDPQQAIDDADEWTAADRHQMQEDMRNEIFDEEEHYRNRHRYRRQRPPLKLARDFNGSGGGSASPSVSTVTKETPKPRALQAQKPLAAAEPTMLPEPKTKSTVAVKAANSIAAPPAVADIFIQYERQLHKVTVEMQAKLLKYETAPEQHPLYPTEWKNFWSRRSAELQLEGKDTAAYDYSADWTRFWLVRVLELHEEELKRADRRIRREMDLPLDGPVGATASEAAAATKAATASLVNSVDQHRRPQNRATSTTSSSAAAAAKGSPSSSDVRSRSRERERERRHREQAAAERRITYEHSSMARAAERRSRFDRERSPNAVGGVDHRRVVALPQPAAAADRTGHRRAVDEHTSREKSSAATNARNNHNHNAPPAASAAFNLPVEPVSDEDNVPAQSSASAAAAASAATAAAAAASELQRNLDESFVAEPVTVISVLRLLSAFEDLLGSSLGPRVVDLLSKAVALEKVKANLADDLLMSADNSVLLDTVKEKLKGLLLAGVVERYKVKAVRNVVAHVNSITRIIDAQTQLKEAQNMAEARLNLERLKEQDRLAEEQRKVREAEQKVRDEADARALVMKQVATSITLQGKRITKEQLEALTDVYLKNHTAEDTPYLFGLQMGARFPDLKEDSGGEQPMPTSQETLSSSQEFPDQHPMHWNAHHQPPVGGQQQQQQGGYGGGAYGGQLQQQQMAQQQQMPQQQQQQMYNNSYGYYGNQNSQQQQPQQQQQHSNQLLPNPPKQQQQQQQPQSHSRGNNATNRTNNLSLPSRQPGDNASRQRSNESAYEATLYAQQLSSRHSQQQQQSAAAASSSATASYEQRRVSYPPKQQQQQHGSNGNSHHHLDQGKQQSQHGGGHKSTGSRSRAPGQSYGGGGGNGSGGGGGANRSSYY